jgi:sphingosine kinase
MRAFQGSLAHSGVSVEGLIERKTLRNACFPQSSTSTSSSSSSCSWSPHEGDKTLIPFTNILSAKQLDNSTVQIVYAKHASKTSLYPCTIRVSLAEENGAKRIIEEAYRGSKPNKRLLVLVNPHGGQGKAQTIYKTHGAPIFAAAGCETTVMVTTHRFHAVQIAQELDVDAYDAVVCCSGDGIPHEVINGFMKRYEAKRALRTVPVCQLPCGSGNSMAMSLNGTPSPSKAALCIVKGFPMKVDLMCMTQGNHTFLSFLSQTYGLVADCDLGTENLRWMGGSNRFAVGALLRAISQASYPCELSFKYAHQTKKQVSEHFNRAIHTSLESQIGSDPKINLDPFNDGLSEGGVSEGGVSEGGVSERGVSERGVSEGVVSEGGVSEQGMSEQDVSEQGVPELGVHSLQYGTINDPVPEDWHTMTHDKLALFYVGKMPWMSADALVFPASLPNDGTLDLVLWDTTIGRIKTIELLTKIEKGKHIYDDHVHYAKIEAYRLTPRMASGYLSIDGESYPFAPFQVEVLKDAGCLLSATGAYATTEVEF